MMTQQEIVQAGRGSSSRTAFYKKNNRWTEGLISAAKAVASSTNTLIETADGVLSKRNSPEQLIVASNDVAASTAQLVAASRVKAGFMSRSQERLEQASKAVGAACRSLVRQVQAMIKERSQDEDQVDYTKLGSHEFKVREMEQQVSAGISLTRDDPRPMSAVAILTLHRPACPSVTRSSRSTIHPAAQGPPRRRISRPGRVPAPRRKGATCCVVGLFRFAGPTLRARWEVSRLASTKTRRRRPRRLCIRRRGIPGRPASPGATRDSCQGQMWTRTGPASAALGKPQNSRWSPAAPPMPTHETRVLVVGG